MAIALLVACGPSAAFAGHDFFAYELAGGIHANFDGDHRKVYGINPVVSLGASLPVGDGPSRFFLDVDHVRAAGREFPDDPTFNAGETRYQLTAIHLGLRRPAGGKREGARTRVWLGAAWETMFTRYEPFGRQALTSPTLGILFELRPEILLRDGWRLWIRQRIRFPADIEYDSRIPDISYQASLLQIGLEWRP